MLPLLTGLLADDGTQETGLADTITAEHAGHLARLGDERDAAQGLRRTVMQIDGFHVQHRRYALLRMI
jgi:hypothetical protein